LQVFSRYFLKSQVKKNKPDEHFDVATRVAELEVKCPVPTPIFPKFPTPIFPKFLTPTPEIT